MIKKMEKEKIIKKLLLILIIFLIILTLSSCKRKSTIKNEEYIIDETQQENQYIEIIEDDQNVDWDKEKEKLKGVGKLDVRSFSTITVILFRETKELKTELEKEQLDEKKIKQKINEKKEELFKYFGITKEQYNEFYKKNKNEVDNFIASHPSYYNEIEVEQGY